MTIDRREAIDEDNRITERRIDPAQHLEHLRMLIDERRSRPIPDRFVMEHPVAHIEYPVQADGEGMPITDLAPLPAARVAWDGGEGRGDEPRPPPQRRFVLYY